MRAPELIFALGHRFARRQMALPLFCSSPSLFCFSRARLQCCNPQHQYRRSIFQPNEFRGPVFVVSFFSRPPCQLYDFPLDADEFGVPCRLQTCRGWRDWRERARSNIGLIWVCDFEIMAAPQGNRFRGEGGKLRGKVKAILIKQSGGVCTKRQSERWQCSIGKVNGLGEVRGFIAQSID